ncbi:MAG: hypothetical protein ACLQDV_00715 [Candidatus Binataceae bacterium]
MKPAVITLFVATALFYRTFALAGSVEIGFVDDAGLEQWTAGGPAEIPTGETACTPAKFGETSECRTVVVFNHSSQAITLRFTSSNSEFSTGVHGGFAMFGPGPPPCSALNVNEHLEPGGRCYEPVEFWPRTGEARYGTIRVIVESSNGTASTYFKVKGTSDYPPELQAAEEVRERHENELKKIPQVASVELDNEDGIKIDVTVKDADDIEAVRRLVPPKIEGYETEVTQYIEHGYFL